MSLPSTDERPGTAADGAPDPSHPAPHRGRVRGWQLLVALFLAPAAFTAQIMGAYVVASRTCAAGGLPRVPLMLLHLSAILAAGAGVAVAWALWRRTRDEKPGDAEQAIDRGEGRTRFLALCGFYASLVFLLAVLVDASALVFFGACPGLTVPS